MAMRLLQNLHNTLKLAVLSIPAKLNEHNKAKGRCANIPEHCIIFKWHNVQKQGHPTRLEYHLVSMVPFAVSF
jgi:hypothetical protein